MARRSKGEHMGDPVSGLQFDTAEPTRESTGDVRCVSCGDALDSYFEVNRAVACKHCKDKAVAAFGGSHLPTLVKATALGLAAAVAGSALYYGIAVLTGYEIGLISIVVGLLVGFAVRKGSRGRGGWRYQALAIFLTYLAIASTYVPRVFSAMEEQKTQHATATPTGAPAGSPAPAAGDPAGTGTSAPAAEAAEPPTVGGFLVAIATLFALTLALPFLAGFDNLMGLVIIAIGLYEAWKVNRAPALSVTGPYTVGAPRAAGG
jgi:hypothetical protein